MSKIWALKQKADGIQNSPPSKFIVRVLLCGFEHQDRIENFECWAQLNAHNFHNVCLGHKQKCLSINLLKGRKKDKRLWVDWTQSRGTYSRLNYQLFSTCNTTTPQTGIQVYKCFLISRSFLYAITPPNGDCEQSQIYSSKTQLTGKWISHKLLWCVAIFSTQWERSKLRNDFLKTVITAIYGWVYFLFMLS